MKIGIHIDSTPIPEPVISVPVLILYALIEVALFFGCQKFSFALSLSFRIIFMLHDAGYGIYESVEASSGYEYWYCAEGTNSTSIEYHCREYSCLGCTYSCDICTDNCVRNINNSLKYCTYKNAMIASSVLFFISLILGMATIGVFSRLPRDQCCGPCCGSCCCPGSQQQAYSMQTVQVEPSSVTVSNEKITLKLINLLVLYFVPTLANM